MIHSKYKLQRGAAYANCIRTLTEQLSDFMSDDNPETDEADQRIALAVNMLWAASRDCYQVLTNAGTQAEARDRAQQSLLEL